MGKSVIKETEPVLEPCWYCKHNEVSDLCSDCLRETELFEKSKAEQGKYKPAWEYGTVDERWVKDKD